MQYKIKHVFRGMLISGVVLASGAIASQVQAAEQITLSYQGSQASVTRSELESFTETGVLPEAIQTLLGTDAEVPNVIRTLLNREIKVPGFLDKFLSSATGEFVLSQLDDTISSTSGRTEQDLFDLKAAFSSAGSDSRLSFMEIVRQYPQKNVRVDLTSLEGTYNRVSNFVERVQPALEVAKGFLSDIICDCDTASVTPTTHNASNESTGEPLYSNANGPCNTTSASSSTVQTPEPELTITPDHDTVEQVSHASPSVK